MLNLIIISVAFLALICFLAKKDGTVTLIKKNYPADALIHTRLKRWHTDGVFIHAIPAILVAYLTGMWWQVLGINLLMRLSVYDVVHNLSAQLPARYMGTTALWDRIFAKIFRENAVLKAVTFGILSLGFLVAVHFLKLA